jgi:hypothetical protein
MSENFFGPDVYRSENYFESITDKDESSKNQLSFHCALRANGHFNSNFFPQNIMDDAALENSWVKE